jgi:RimJ/RimL family protein N-acetyltransferase
MQADRFTTSLETERLILRTWKLDDFDTYARIYADADVMQFLSAHGKPMSRFDAWFSFSLLVGHWYLRGFGMFAVVDRATGDVVGRIGPWLPEGWPGFEVGWSLRREYWGRGYATEAVKACIRHSFETLGQPHVISLIDPENIRSIRVAERAGERLEGTTTLPDRPDKPILQYGIRRENWAG